jgi:DNA polymerase-1
MNFQNIPRDLKIVKKAFIPRHGVFHFFDYKAIEPRLTAYYAERIGHPELADALRAGIDPYTAIARIITGKDSITDEERTTWKVAYLSLLYGGGIATIQLQFGCGFGKARSMIKTFHSEFPAVRALQDSVCTAHGEKGFIYGVDGRHLHLEPDGEHKLLNKLIQGSAAVVMKEAVVKVNNYCKSAGLVSQPVLTIHDELVLDGPKREIILLHDNIPALMDYPKVSAFVPILVDHELALTTWADKIHYDDWRRDTP